MATSIDLTTRFRTQPKVISPLQSIDIAYIDGELGNIRDKIFADAADNRLQELYYVYLYGQSFVNYKDNIQIMINMELRKKGLTGFKLLLTPIGTRSELATYPTLCGIRVQISTIN